jgi:hypothetical protein
MQTAAFLRDLGGYRRRQMEMERQEKDGERQENAEPAPRARIL